MTFSVLCGVVLVKCVTNRQQADTLPLVYLSQAGHTGELRDIPELAASESFEDKRRE
jgi:hypothetical protein